MQTQLPNRSIHIALLPWGHTFEDFLDGIGVSFDQFCTEMSGGWLFGYVQALQLAGFRVTIFCFSRRVRITVWAQHQPTNAEICLIPSKRSYRWMRSFVSSPYAWETANMFAGKKIPMTMKKLLRHLLPYFATPIMSLRREIRRRGIDAILCQEYEYARFDIVTALGWMLGLPVFATFQGGNWQISRFEKFARPLALKRCTGLIIGPADEAARVRMQYRLAARKIARIPNPIDLTQWQPVSRTKAREALGLSSSARIAISHGRVDIFRKGLDVLLDAWTKVQTVRPRAEWRLILIGYGDDASKLRSMLSRLNSVVWIDRYIGDRSQMRRWLSAADVYVMASRHEGFPVAPLEAMACGLPVVATAVPGIAELMGEEKPLPGIMVPNTDVSALSDALARLLGDTELSRALGCQAKKRVQKFSLESVSGQLRDFLLTGATSDWAPTPV